MQSMIDGFVDRVKSLKHLPAAVGVVRCSLFCFLIFMVIWSVITSVLLVALTLHYVGAAIDLEREWYVVNASVVHMYAEVRAALLPAYQCQTALRRAIRAGLVTGPASVSALELVHVPILASSSILSGIELAFSQGPTTLAIRRTPLADGSHRITIKSDGESCYLLGSDGCMDASHSGSPSCFLLGSGACHNVGGPPPWYGQGLSLVENTILPGEHGHFASGWIATPVLEARRSEDGADSLVPASRLLFRVSEMGPDGVPVTVVGRVTIDIGGLSGSTLQDERLGPMGKVYLVDVAKRVLAAVNPGEVLAPDGLGGLHFRSLANLAALGSVSTKLANAAQGADVTVYDAEGRLGVLRWLPAPLGDFAIVAYAPERGPFLHMPMLTASLVSAGVAVLPYVAAVIGFIVLVVYDCVTAKRLGFASERMESAASASTG